MCELTFSHGLQNTCDFHTCQFNSHIATYARYIFSSLAGV